MKKFYALAVVCLALTLCVSAQTKYTWTGLGGDSKWSTPSNWSVGVGYPQLSTDSVVIAIPASISFDVNASVRTLIITGGANVKITGIGGSSKTLSIYGSVTGLQIDAGAKLESDATGATEFVVNFTAGSKGSVSGEWLLSGGTDPNIAYFTFPSTETGMRLTVNNGGKMTVGPLGFIAPNEIIGNVDLVFSAGSTLEFQSDGAVIPEANYDPASTISIIGLINNGIVFNETVAIGNLVYNCPAQQVDADFNMYNFTIGGNFTIASSNDKEVALVGTRTIPDTKAEVTVKGNFTITGNSVVTVSKSYDGKTTNLIVNGDFTADGTRFDLQSDADAALPTNLLVKGNFDHISGSFGASSSAVSNSTNLYNVILNGSGQTLSSSGSLDNLTLNRQVALTLATTTLDLNVASDVEVGRLNFTAADTATINTGTHVLTVTNPSTASIQGKGVIIGSLGRATSSATAYTFPTSVGGTTRMLTLTPDDANPSSFVVSLKSGNNGGALQSPVSGLANYYWQVIRPAGSSAAKMSMPLVGAIPGASAIDTLVAVAYNGSTWMDARSTPTDYIFPGNSSSGTLATSSQPTVAAYTIGYMLNSALPINLLSFTGRKIQDHAELVWKITDNSTPAKFEIVKSADGKKFVSIGAVSGTEGKLDYAFTDNSLSSGNNFYRLKMYDIDGSISYSNIIVIMNGSKGVLISSMIPTIVRDRARLNVSSSIAGNMQLVITDITGRVVKNQIVAINSGNQEVWVDAVALSAGMFQLTGYINGERTGTFRFIKQ